MTFKPSQSPILPEHVQEALSVPQAAKFLGVSIGTLNNYRTSGRGPRYVRIGARITYRIKDLEAFQEQCARSSTSDAA